VDISHALADRTDLSRSQAAAVVALGLLAGAAALSVGGNVGVLAVVGGGSALAVLLLTLVIARGRVVDLLLLSAVAFMAFPLDTYLMFRDHVGGWPGLRISVSDLALIALVPLAVIGWWTGRTRNAVPRPVIVVYSLLLLQYLISTFGAADRGLALFEMASAVHALATAMLVAALFRRELLKPVLLLAALLVVLHTTIAAAQVVTGQPIGATWFAGGAGLVTERLETGVERIRPSGLFDHPIVYADMLLLAIPMFFAGLFIAGGRVWRTSMAAALLIAVCGLAVSLSRGAWISTCIAGAVFFALVWRHHMWPRRQLVRVLGRIAVVALLLSVFFAKPVYERLTASDEGNLGVRFELNWIAVSMIQAHPLAGVGLSNFLPVMADYDPTNVMRRFPATVHNVYLLEAAEAGIPAAVLFIALFATIVGIGLRRLPSIADPAAKWLAVAILAGLIGFLVTQVADFSHRLEPLRSLIWMNIGLLFALYPRRGASRLESLDHA
jgi:O-antigen ligase